MQITKVFMSGNGQAVRLPKEFGDALKESFKGFEWLYVFGPHQK